jgi:tungstate transport system ATP-binding protein
MIPAYSLKDLTFSYQNRPALEIDRLEIPAGEIVALVGPNGSGKTTLLHNLAFIEAPQRGLISFFGEPFCKGKLLSFRRRVGLLLQNPYLFHTSVLSNLLWGLRVRGVPRRTGKKTALAALAMVGLGGFENRYARSLSGGEAQRVALARALVLEPEVLLLDEPANHMDRESVQRTGETVLELNKKRGTTVVLTSHDFVQVQALTNRVICLSEGKIVPSLVEGQACPTGFVFT